MATIKDVARRAGVSISTVSYVQSGERPISEQTRAQVFRAMEELGYKTHAIARSLASKKTRILALLFPPMEREMGPSEFSFVSAAAKAARDLCYHLVLWILKTDTVDELHSLLRQNLVDGVLLAEVRDNDFRIPVLAAENIPFHLVGQDKELPNQCADDLDFTDAFEQALSLFAHYGRHRLCFINQSPASRERRYGPVIRAHEAFAEAVGRRGLAANERFANSDAQSGFQTVSDLLEREPEVNGILVMNDRILSGVLKGIEAAGKRIPEDISVISVITSSAVASLYIPRLTTVEADWDTIMRLAVQRLVEKTNDPNSPNELRKHRCVLVERESTTPYTGEKEIYP